MSDIGYRNDSQSGLDISFDNLNSYVSSLVGAINTPAPAYEQFGVKVNGEYRQLSANILQISNEYYSPIRPKQVARSCESPTIAMKRRGVRYVELRSLDLGMAHPLGLSLAHMRFLELFLLCCLMHDSPFLDAAEKAETSRNALTVACKGRMPGLLLRRGGAEISLRDWAQELAEDLQALAEILDNGTAETGYADSLAPLWAAIDNPESTPSSKILADMREHHETFQAYALRVSQLHAESFRARPLASENAAEFVREAAESWAAQKHIEAEDKLNFDDFLADYFAQVD
jgi:glutamate--cysteine ligase